MHNRTQSKIKLIVLGFIGLSIFVIVLFFAFIAPYRTMPILMYHFVIDTTKNSENLVLEKKIFQKQMEYLSKHNYAVVPLERAVGLMKAGKTIPPNWVALTFDDGGEDFYRNVYPVIKKYQFAAALFVYIDKIERDKYSLSWRQIDYLHQDSLVTIGSHSLSHQPLVLLSTAQAEKEINESKLILENKLKGVVKFFSYPFGALNQPIRQMVQESGYLAAVGIAYRKGEFKDNDVYLLRRVFVSKISRFPLMFKFMVSGYYVPTKELLLRVLNIKTPRDVYK